MVTETLHNRTSLLHKTERSSHRRHHTLDNATLDQFNFICVPLHIDEDQIDQSTPPTHSNRKSNELKSSTRRVRFKFDDNQHIHSSDDIRLPEKFSIHRVEFQIPIHKDINPYLNVDGTSIPAKTRSITSQKIDINYPNMVHQQSVRSVTDSPIVCMDDRTRNFFEKLANRD